MSNKIHRHSDWGIEGAGNSSVLTMFFPLGNNANNVTIPMSIHNLSPDFKPEKYLNVMQVI
ncbi:MAG TPA: hypothetical protein VFI73_01385 [Candidatus Nitrosopolaris sp.]|nr:hypothetical protein [Candidatus Nitrosopolaris sp.]